MSPARPANGRAAAPPTDALALLKEDHRAVEALFGVFEASGPRALAKKKKAVAAIVEALSVHAAIEEGLFYPAVRAEVAGSVPAVLEALEEHHVVKWELSELDGLDPTDERFDAKVTVLIENVRHHVREEERELFPKVKAALGRQRLAELGAALAEAKPLAPTHPHPRSPDTPPANLVADLVSGGLDRARDAVVRALDSR